MRMKRDYNSHVHRNILHKYENVIIANQEIESIFLTTCKMSHGQCHYVLGKW